MGSNLSQREHEMKNVQELMQYNLKELYKQLNIPKVAWMGPLQEFYVKLKLTRINRVIHHHEMFQKIETKRILVEGLPGYGKTTLATKIARDWAVNEEYTRRFHFVFLLSIRELRGNSVIDAIVELIRISGFDKPEEVKRIIEKDGEKILLILDGLDEVESNEREKILKILYKRERMTVVVTCRRGEFSLKRDEGRTLFSGLPIQTEFCDLHVTLLGVQNEDKIEFLTKFLHEVESVDKVIEYLKNVTETTGELFDSPLMLILLVDMVVRGHQIGPTTTRTNFYKDMVNFMIRRSQERRNVQLSKSFNVFDEKNKENSSFKRKLHQFGYLCFQRVWSGNQLEFDEDELIESIHRLGFVIIRKRLSNTTFTSYYQIYHRTILEFMAAYYIHQQFLNNNFVFPEFIQNKLIIDVYYYGRLSSMVTPFLIGLMKEKASHYFLLMSSKYINFFQEHDRGKRRMLMECENLAEVETDLIPNLPSKINNSHSLIYAPHIYKRLVTLGVQSGRLQDIHIDSYDEINLPTDIELPNVHWELFNTHWVYRKRAFDIAIEGLKQIKCQRFHWFTLYDEEEVNKCFEILSQISAKVHIFEIENEAIISFLQKEDEWPSNMEITIKINWDITNWPVAKEICNLLNKCHIHLLHMSLFQEEDEEEEEEKEEEKEEKEEEDPELDTILSHCKNVKHLELWCSRKFPVSMDALFLDKQWESIKLSNIELTSPSVKDFYACKSVKFFDYISCAFTSKVRDISYLECEYDTLGELMSCSSWQGFHTITQIKLRVQPITDYDCGFWKSFKSFRNLECLTIYDWYDLETSIRRVILEEVLLLPIPKIIVEWEYAVDQSIVIEDVSDILRNVIVRCLKTLTIQFSMPNHYSVRRELKKNDVLKWINILQYCSEKKMSLKNLNLMTNKFDESIFEIDIVSNVHIKYSFDGKRVIVLLSNI